MSTRYHVTVAVVAATLAVCGVRLADLQLRQGAALAAQAEGNAVKARAVAAPRGRLLDRQGRLLVDNAPAFDIWVTPALFSDQRLADLARLVGRDAAALGDRLAAARAHNPNTPVVLASGLSVAWAGRVREQLHELSGVEVVEGQRRAYPGGGLAPFALGTVGEIGPAELDRRRAAGEDVRLGEIVGRSGAEQAYDALLRGHPGIRYELVDALGRRRGRWRDGTRDTEPVAGYDLTLALDAGVQALAESLFVGKRGAAVALDPRDGAIVAYVSAPSVHPATLVPPVAPATWARLADDPARPLFDRAALSPQPLGSTTKPFMALLALQEGVLDTTTTVTCGGAYVWGGHVFRDHGAHGRVAVHDAIRRSCNTFFFTAMMRTPFDAWTRWGRAVGFGQPVASDLPTTGAGLWPDSSYFDDAFGAWTRGYLVSLGIGQGDLGVTPLQLARYTAVLANGGTPVAPHLARVLRHPDTGHEVRPGLPRFDRLAFDPEHVAAVQRAMVSVVEAGTARRSRIEGIAMAGKTGTAENPHGDDHALFIGYAPAEAPRIAVAVLVENAGFGSQSAAPIASLMIERALTGRTAPERRALRDAVVAVQSSD